VDLKEPHILNPWLLFAYSLYNFYAALMTIKPNVVYSLACVPNVKVHRPIQSKNCPVKRHHKWQFKKSEVKILNFYFIAPKRMSFAYFALKIVWGRRM